MEKALEICRELNDKTNISVAICNMGIVHTQRNDNTAAMACFEECLTLAQELGNKLLVSTIIGNMGPVYRAEGDYTAAMKCAEEEWKICQEIGHKSGACHSIGNMGTIYIDRGDYDSAMGCLEECLEMAQQLGAKQLTSIAYGHLGNINREKGDYETAVDHYDRAITIARELEIKNYLCDYLIDKAEALYLTQGFSEARMLSSEGLHLAEEVGHKKQIFKGSVLVAKSDFALGHREKGVAVLSEMLAGAEDDSEIADLNYDLFELQSETTNEDLRIKAEEHGETALGLYLELYKKTPKFEYKKRIEKLGKKPI